MHCKNKNASGPASRASWNYQRKRKYCYRSKLYSNICLFKVFWEPWAHLSLLQTSEPSLRPEVMRVWLSGVKQTDPTPPCQHEWHCSCTYLSCMSKVHTFTYSSDIWAVSEKHVSLCPVLINMDELVEIGFNKQYHCWDLTNVQQSIPANCCQQGLMWGEL